MLLAAFALGGIFAAAQPAAQDFNGDGKSDIFWRNKTSGENAVWLLDGLVVTQAIPLQTSRELDWKLIAPGLFNADQRPDLLWHNLRTGEKAVWFMDRATVLSNALIKPDLEVAWQLAGVGDFNADGKSDLVWQHESTGEKAIWIMDGTTLVRGAVVDRASGPDWRIGAVGQFGGDPTPDLVLRNRRTAAIAVWIMQGTDISSPVEVTTIQRPDLDWQIVGAADFTGDGQTDVLWRHAVLGLNYVSIMAGTQKTGEEFILNSFDTEWRVASQDVADSRYRLSATYGPILSATPTQAPEPQLRLNLNFALKQNQTIELQRRLAGETNWGAPIATGLPPGVFIDTNVVAGARYEYRAINSVFRFSPALLAGGVRATPLETRGRIVLLVDNALASAFPKHLGVALAQIREDLAGDGWTVVQRNVPRHDDRANAAANTANQTSVAGLRTLLRAERALGAKGAILLGHVPIAYAGFFAPDGHPDHSGAWASDMPYADLDGDWTDTRVNLAGTPNPENANVPGDGKFDNNFVPSELELFIGRIDFARLPAFKTDNAPTEAEARLIQQYVAKARRYRLNLAPYPVADAGAAYGFLSATGREGVDAYLYENALRNFAVFYPDGTNRLEVGDPMLPRGRTSAWGFVAGQGAPWALNVNASFLEHSTAKLAAGASETPVAFYSLIGSYFGDWNYKDDFMRALLATPNYGLSCHWIAPNPAPTFWQFYPLAMGESLGAALLATINEAPRFETGSNARVLTLLGDPTLRLHILNAPANVETVTRTNEVQLTWKATEPDAQYFVYRGAGKVGPFRRITPHPLSAPRFTDPERSSSETVYMVRALKLMTSGAGSYTNLSQGIFAAEK